MSWRHLSISGISQLILTRFWPNFKCRFLGPSLTDANSHNDICQGNICPGNIFPYHEYLSYNWPWPYFLNQNCFGIQKNILTQNFFEPKFICDPKLFWTQNFWDPKFFWTANCFQPNFFWRKILFGLKNFLIQNYFIPRILDSKYFLDFFFNKDFLIR